MEEDGYNFKRKRSRSEDKSNQLQPSRLKLKPSIRSEQIKAVSEDIEEAKKEMALLDQARIQARNVNADERALRLTKHFEPIRLKKDA